MVAVIDGALLPGNPCSGRFPRDGASHRVRVEAPGFSTDSRMLVFDKDVNVEVALAPEKGGTAQNTPTKGTTQGSPANDGFGTKPGKPPKKKLDSSDPWAK